MSTWRGNYITLEFGYKHPRYTRLGYHTGTDFRFALGSKQPAFATGIARYRKQVDNMGNTGTITLPNGDVIVYAHLKNNGILVPSGSKVQDGQPVFVTGDTGAIAGVHAHVEYRIKGSATNVVDITKKLPEEEIMDTDAKVQSMYNLLRGKSASATEVKSWKGKTYKAFAESSNTRTEVTNRTKNVTSLEKQVADLEKQVGELTKRINELEKALEISAENMADYLDKNTALANKVIQLTDETIELEAEIGRLMAGEKPEPNPKPKVEGFNFVGWIISLFKKGK